MTTLADGPSLLAGARLAEAVEWRRHLHRNPELSFQEHETSAFVEETLRSFGLETRRPTPTSVVATLRNGTGRTIALRADIDALPIDEESGVEFASTRPGVMHACGHDMHTATLLAVARTLSERRSELAGEVRFVFQHAEEQLPGGAQELVAAGVVDGCDAVVGCHVFSGEPAGTIAVSDGAFMAAADFFELTVRGKGGHGAMPNLSIDPVVCAAEIVLAFQSIVTRELSPLARAVITTATLRTDSTRGNVIPEQVELGGTVRTFDQEVREHVAAAMGRIAESVAAAHRCTAELDYQWGYAPTVNDLEVAALVRRNVPAGRLHEIEPTMGGEDFSAYGAAAPACFFIAGAGGPGAFPHHHPRFVVDEAAMPAAHDTFVGTVLDFLRAG
ncbi:MAG TPA: amidohydrolase [Gaiellaceae bacterium]|nr:amidohydrolase [Gaiellaceae bacterium]